jgi:GH15 family glucan-1,4-alpha-glucosidase
MGSPRISSPPILLKDKYQPIEDYSLIGDLRTAALVGNWGSIDFLCFPKFDSPSIFCANADYEKGGYFQIEPLLSNVREKKLYLPDTNVLFSRFLSKDGISEISDFMVVEDVESEQALVRRVKTVHGAIRYRMTCAPRFNYAQAEHTIEKISDNEYVFRSSGEDKLAIRIRSSVTLDISGKDVIADFTLENGQHASFILEEAILGVTSPTTDQNYTSDAFKRTSSFWRNWISHSQYKGRWREMVNRSALALKLLTSREHGSIVAAPCFGFPNEIGGERNWDYRFTWIRDASFTLYALMRLGYTSEAGAFMKWLEDRIGELDDGGSLQIMYGIDGSPHLEEFHLDHLEGYMQSRPVRIGSTNYHQKQFDIYGEIMDSVYLYDKRGESISHNLWTKLTRLIEYVCQNWMMPDSGIWEVRGGDQEFTFSRVMCWVAMDRAIRLAKKRSRPAPLLRWEKVRDEIYNSVFQDLWNEERQAFVQFKGATAMDAATLIMPLVKIISPTDPKWLSTLKAIENDLVEDSLVYRYRVGEAFSDMLEGTEGTFSICSFWYIECVSRSGDLEKARYLFEKMLGYGNRVGLFSEQLGTHGEFLGNVPQAFTHLALISAAFDLNRRLNEQGL